MNLDSESSADLTVPATGQHFNGSCPHPLRLTLCLYLKCAFLIEGIHLGKTWLSNRITVRISDQVEQNQNKIKKKLAKGCHRTI
jgi:hypothetical protein